MIHSLSGGIITLYDTLIYVFVRIDDGIEKDTKRWYISPFSSVKIGNRANVEDFRGNIVPATILRVEKVTAQTAPFPVNKTREICNLLSE